MIINKRVLRLRNGLPISVFGGREKQRESEDNYWERNVKLLMKCGSLAFGGDKNFKFTAKRLFGYRN